MVEFYDTIKKENINYHIDRRLIKFLDKKVKEQISKRDKDYVLLIDGYEGSGKSTFAAQIGKYVDPSLTLDRICMTANEFKEAIIHGGHNQCVIYDEAVTGLTSGDSITRIGRLLKSMMMQMRQKNLFVIVVLPIIFELNKYAVLSRAKSFFHIYETGGRTGYFVGYNRKDLRLLYIKGKKTYSYKIRSRFIGRFYGKWALGKEEYEFYIKKKEETLFQLEEEDEFDKKYEQRNRLLKLIKEEMHLTLENMEILLAKYGIHLKRNGISTAIRQIHLENKENFPNSPSPI